MNIWFNNVIMWIVYTLKGKYVHICQILLRHNDVKNTLYHVGNWNIMMLCVIVCSNVSYLWFCEVWLWINDYQRKEKEKRTMHSRMTWKFANSNVYFLFISLHCLDYWLPSHPPLGMWDRNTSILSSKRLISPRKTSTASSNDQ